MNWIRQPWCTGRVLVHKIESYVNIYQISDRMDVSTYIDFDANKNQSIFGGKFFNLNVLWFFMSILLHVWNFF